MKFIIFFAFALIASAYAEDDKQVDKRAVVLTSSVYDPYYYNYFYGNYVHLLKKRDTEAVENTYWYRSYYGVPIPIVKRDTEDHIVEKRDVSEQVTDQKTDEKRDLVLGYGPYNYFRSYPYYPYYPYYY